MPRFKNLAEKRFGKLTAIEVAGKKGGTYLWKCKCDCGNFTIVYGRDLQNGHTQSCGCLKKENHPKTHGDKHTRLYRIWKDMRQRCNNPNNSHYYLYGGRGIKIDERWETYPPFKEWALSNGYSDNLTIDRIDNDKNYSPDNCRWATQVEQMNNVSYNRYITLKGETHTLAEWGRITGILSTTIRHRIIKGWEIERALTEKPYKGKNQYCASVQL